MSPSSPLRGVLHGHGHMGRRHADALSRRADVQLVVVDPAQGTSEQGPEQPDFAIIAAPTGVHADIALPLLSAGVPCLVEKPLAATVEEARNLSGFSHLSVGHIERFNPAFVPVDKLQPKFIQADRLAPFTVRGTDVDVIADLMIHDLDLVLRFMPGEVVDVRATGINVRGANPDIVNARIEIAAEDGSVGTAVLTASRVSRSHRRTFRLVAPGEYWSLDLLNHRATKVPWGSGVLEEQSVDVAQTDALWLEHEAFLGAVRGTRPFPCPGTEALAALCLAERIRSCLSC